MERILLVSVMVLAIGATLQAQAAPDAAELTALLREFLAGASRNDAAIHDKFWAEDLIYTGANGMRRSKADVLRSVRSAPAPKVGDPKPPTPPKTSASSSTATPPSSLSVWWAPQNVTGKPRPLSTTTAAHS